MRLHLLALPLITACGPFSEVHPPDRSVDPEFAPILAEWLSDAEERGVAVDVGALGELRLVKWVDSLEPGDIGHCSVITQVQIPARGVHTAERTDRWREISILRAVEPDATLLRAILYHELGHCVLGRVHAAQDPYTLMSPNLAEDSYLEEHWGELVDGLFKP